MSNKYTAGPWKVSAHDDTGEQVVRSVSTLNIVCNCEADGFGEVGEAETKANAALISAAPDMVEALDTITQYFIERHEESQTADYDGAENAMHLHKLEEPDCTYCAAIAKARAALAKAGL